MGLIDEATRLHSRRILLLGLYLAHAALPDTVLRILKGDSSVTALGEQICTRMIAGAERPGKLARLRTTIKTIERRSDRLRFVLSLGLQPTAGDYAMVASRALCIRSTTSCARSVQRGRATGC